MTSGKDIELYGTVSHEYGFEEYYALNSAGESFFGTVDYESGQDINYHLLY